VTRKVEAKLRQIGMPFVAKHRVDAITDDFIQDFSAGIVAGHFKYDSSRRTLLGYLRVSFENWARRTFVREHRRPAEPLEFNALRSSQRLGAALQIVRESLTLLDDLEMEVITRNPDLPMASSIVDYVCQWLRQQFGEQPAEDLAKESLPRPEL